MDCVIQSGGKNYSSNFGFTGNVFQEYTHFQAASYAREFYDMDMDSMTLIVENTQADRDLSRFLLV